MKQILILILITFAIAVFFEFWLAIGILCFKVFFIGFIALMIIRGFREEVK